MNIILKNNEINMQIIGDKALYTKFIFKNIGNIENK